MKNYLQWLAEDTASVWWHDSADTEEALRAISHGAVGSTTNPVLVSQALESKRDIIAANADEIKAAKNGDEKAEAIIKAVTVDLAEKFLPAFEQTNRQNGYVCAQVNPGKSADADYMIENALRINGWAENISVKLPVTKAGLEAIEECAALGVNITATVSFSVAQALAVAERYEKGYARALKTGKTPNMCNAVIMVGRLDDYLRDVAQDRRAGIEERDIISAGAICAKRAYGLFQKIGCKPLIMPAGMRGAYHATGFAGARVRMSIHPTIQNMILAANPEKIEAIAAPADEAAVSRLMQLDEFARAYEPDGMKPEEFITYGATQKTLASFVEAWARLAAFVL